MANEPLYCWRPFFGFVPAWNHEIRFSQIDDDNHVLNTMEKGGMVTTWNHSIRVKSLSDFTCTYSDEVEINAGFLTPLVWLGANSFYRYRQWRWKSLLTLHPTGSISEGESCEGN